MMIDVISRDKTKSAPRFFWRRRRRSREEEEGKKKKKCVFLLNPKKNTLSQI